MPIVYSTKSEVAINRQATMTFTVTRSGTSGDLAQSSQVAFQTKDNTAIAGTDYTSTSGQLSFATNEVEKKVAVAILDAAYDATTATEFFFALQGAGTATGTIEPATKDSAQQSYLVVPQSGVTAPVPTTDAIEKDQTSGKASEDAEKAGTPTYQTIKYQADYENLGDGDATRVDMPYAYLRFGYARQDLNDYERVVVNDAAFHPDWSGWNDGVPREIGPMTGRMRPRGIDRNGDPKAYGTTLDALKKYNANLDGLLLFSGSNYMVTVGRHLNRVVQGDRTDDVGGQKSQVINKGQSIWTYYDGSLHYATGLDKINSRQWSYDISTARQLKISAQPIVRYAMDQQFRVNTSGIYEIRNDATFTVHNSVTQHTSGMAASINADILGNFSVSLPGSTHSISSFADFQIAGSEGFALIVNPELSATAAVAVGISSAAVAAFAAATMTPGFVTRFQSEKSFFQNANSENLGSDYAETFTTALPDTLAALEAVNTAIIIAAAISQVCRDWWPSANPAVTAQLDGVRDTEYDFWSDEIWVPPNYDYAQSKIALKIGSSSIGVNGGAIESIILNTPALLINAETIDIGNELVPIATASLTGDSISIVSPTIGFTSAKTAITPLLQVEGDISTPQAATAFAVLT